MNHYPHHIGDYRRDTMHLSLLEHGCYRSLMDMYYLSEEPIPDDIDDVARRLCARTEFEIQTIKSVLSEFFKLTAKGWVHNRCQYVINNYKHQVESGRKGGKAGGRPRKTPPVSTEKPTINQEPITSKPKEANASLSPAGDLLQTDLIDPNPEGLTKAEPLACPVQRIVDLYHQHMPENPKVKVMNAQRTSTIKSRWREAAQLRCQPFGYSNVADGLTAWAEFFEICASSPWLTGKVPPSPGRTQFIADIDYLMSPSGFTKCLENKFHRRAA